jgi:hypothetical protein
MKFSTTEIKEYIERNSSIKIGINDEMNCIINSNGNKSILQVFKDDSIINIELSYEKRVINNKQLTFNLLLINVKSMKDIETFINDYTRKLDELVKFFK